MSWWRCDVRGKFPLEQYHRVVRLTFVQNISKLKKKSTKINIIYFLLVRDKRIPFSCLFFLLFTGYGLFQKFREWFTINLKLKYYTKKKTTKLEIKIGGGGKEEWHRYCKVKGHSLFLWPHLDKYISPHVK